MTFVNITRLSSYRFLIYESQIHGPTSPSLSDIFLVLVRCEIFIFFGPDCEWSRIYFIELNTFFGKHYFRYPAKHWLCWGRMLFMGPVSAPAIKQYYSYATDTRCKRLGNHAWVSLNYLRVVQTQAILFLKSMSERIGSDIQGR